MVNINMKSDVIGLVKTLLSNRRVTTEADNDVEQDLGNLEHKDERNAQVEAESTSERGKEGVALMKQVRENEHTCDTRL